MASPYDVTISVRVDQPTGAYRPLWNWFGYDEPNYTYSKHGKQLLKKLAELSPEAPRVRTRRRRLAIDAIGLARNHRDGEPE